MTEMKTLTLPNGVTYEIVDDKARKAIEQDCASALLQTAEGVCILAEDSSDKAIRGLKIFGKTEQEGDPTPDAPVALVDVNPTISIRGGNLIPVEYADGDTKVMNGITFTKQEDGSVRINGVATELAYYSFNTTGNKRPLPSGWLSAYSGIGYGAGIPQVQNDIYVDGVYTLSLQTANKNASVKNLTGKITLGASRIKVDAGVIANNVVVYPMLCASETVLPYETPIDAQTITSGRVLRGLPMASGGTYRDNDNQMWVADEVDFERGVHIKRIGDIVLDGSNDEIWYEEVALDNTVMFRIGIADSVNVGNIVGDDFVCSHFGVGQYYNVDAVGAQHTMSQFYFRIAKSSLSEVSLAGFKAWLADNPMTVQYILNVPVVTPLTEDEMNVFKERRANYPSTIVVNDSDAWMEFKYVADLKKFLANKDLPDDIDELITKAVNDYLEENPPSGSGGNVDFVVDNNPPEDTSVLWVDPDDNDDDGFQEAVNAALAQAKESGEFNGPPGEDYVLTDADKTEIAEMASELVDVPESSGGGISVTGAKVGQTVKISEVDENGVPTAWEPVDFPEGGGGEKPWRKVAEIKTTEELNYISVNKDMDGNPLSFEDVIVMVSSTRAADATSNGNFAISLLPEYATSLNNKPGIYNFALHGDVYCTTVKFKLLSNGLVEINNYGQNRIASKTSDYTFPSKMYYFSLINSGTAGSAIRVATGGILNESGKLHGVTIGTDTVNHTKMGVGTTLEVWIR